MPRYINSLDKIVYSYLSAVAKTPFKYGQKFVFPKPLQVSPQIFRGFICPEHCGGCCPRFSLEYLPTERRPETEKYTVEINDKPVVLYHDAQAERQDHHCVYVDKITGRCAIYEVRPFHCDFELIRVFAGKKNNRLTQQMFGRGWQFLRVDYVRGALCSMLPCTEHTISEVVRKLKRLKEWSDYFGLETWLPEILEWVVTGPHSKPLVCTTPKAVSDSILIGARR